MIEEEYEDQIEIIPVSHISEVLDVALAGEPKGLAGRPAQVHHGQGTRTAGSR